jgi:hypothetical protein
LDVTMPLTKHDAVEVPRKRETCAAWVQFDDAEAPLCWESSWPVVKVLA